MTESNVEKAVRLRLAHAKDPAHGEEWLAAEKLLSDREYDQYVNAYVLAKGMKL